MVKKIEYENCSANDPKCKKVIAGIKGLPSIDFNGFEEQLGVINIEKLAVSHAVKSGAEFREDLLRIKNAFVKGFKTNQELNKSELGKESESLIKILENITSWDSFKGHPISGYAQKCIDKLKSLGQPKEIDIEVEMEDKGGRRQDSMNGCWISNWQFKITDNKIKVTKVL